MYRGQWIRGMVVWEGRGGEGRGGEGRGGEGRGGEGRGGEGRGGEGRGGEWRGGEGRGVREWQIRGRPLGVPVVWSFVGPVLLVGVRPLCHAQWNRLPVWFVHSQRPPSNVHAAPSLTLPAWPNQIITSTTEITIYLRSLQKKLF